MSKSACIDSFDAVDALQNSAHSASVPPSNQPETESRLVLIRGLPGSGKSTMARELAKVGYEHFEADMYFMDHGVYRFDPTRVREAHAWCQDQARQALKVGKRVVVSNTFTRRWEMAPYLAMTTNVRILEAKGKWANVHGVPASTLARMAAQWEV